MMPKTRHSDQQPRVVLTAMVTVGQRAKWERDLAKLLFLELGINFTRNLEQYRTAQGGDLIPDNEQFPFSIEAKHYQMDAAAKKNGGRNPKKRQ